MTVPDIRAVAAGGERREPMVSELLQPVLDNPLVQLSQRLCWLFFVIFSLALVFWTWRDAERRGAMSWFWALVVLLFNVPGWIVYMVVRPPESLADARERELEIRAREAELQRRFPVCPACLKPVEDDYLICPSCMKKLKKECINCGRALKLDWTVCPYCKTKQ
ncbi:MAG: zinc ribbon domain-containing protein [Anaerosomatales bacterium]|nr:zinc ribbon domain-containing protein [Anaerosomatales bacterium]